MRLYKCGFHNVSSLTPFSTAEGTCGSTSVRDADSADFSLSPYLLLPDSFGDIYIGDTFSAYVAVVNGLDDTIFTKVRMDLHLLVGDKTIDLHDTRAPDPLSEGVHPELKKDEYIDKIIAATLTDATSHTLRVNVTYSVGRGMQEVKNMRKSYRFNVLQPLEVTVSASKVGDKAAVQCLVTNTSQAPLLIEDIQFVPKTRGGKCSVLKVPFSGPPVNAEEGGASSALWAPLQDFNIDNIPLLQSGEQQAYGFLITREMVSGDIITGEGNGIGNSGDSATDDTDTDTASFIRSMQGALGHVEVTWCANVGERGVLRGPSVTIASTTIEHESRSQWSRSSSSTPPIAAKGNQTIAKLDLVCKSLPTTEVTVGSRFDITVLCINISKETLRFRVETNNPSHSADHGCGLGLELGLSSFQLAPMESVEFACSVYALRSGVQGAGEVSVVHSDTRELLWQRSDLLQVLVRP